jgi:hypothetical protein
VDVHPVHRSQQVGDRVRERIGDPGVQRIPGGESLSDFGEIHVTPALLEPTLDPCGESLGRSVRMQDVHRQEGPGLRPGRDARDRRSQHQQEPGAARLRRQGPDPGQHRHLEVGDAVGQGDPVLAERSRRIEFQHHDGTRSFRLGQALLHVPTERAIDRPIDLDHVHRRRLRRRPSSRPAGRRDREEHEDDERGSMDGMHGGRIVSSKGPGDPAYPGAYP